MSELEQTNGHRRTNNQMGEIFMDSDILTAHSPLESWTKGDSKELKHFEGPFNKGKSGFETLTYKSVGNRLTGVANLGKTYNLQLISKTSDYTNLSPIRYTKFFSQFKFAISNIYKKKPALNAEPKPNSVSKKKKDKSKTTTTAEKKIKNKEKLGESIQRVKINKNNMKTFTKFRGKTLHYHKSTDSNIKSKTKIVEKKEEDGQSLNIPSKMPNIEVGDRKETKCTKEQLEAVGQKTKKPSLFNNKMEREANSLYKNANSINSKQSLQPIELVKSNSTNEKHAIRELVDICGNKNFQQVTNKPENIQLASNFKTGSRKIVYGEKNINYHISSKINSKSKNCIKEQVNVPPKPNDYKIENNKTLQDENENIHTQSEKPKLNLIKPATIKENENRLHNDQVELEKEVGSPMKIAEPDLTLKDIKDDIIRGHSLSKTQKKKKSKQHQQNKQEILEQNQTEIEKEMEMFLKNCNPDKANDNIDDFLMEDSQITKINKQYKKSRKKKQSDDTLDYDQAMLEKHMKHFMKNTKLGETLRIIKKDKGDNWLNDIKVNEDFRKPQPTRKYDDKHQYDKVGMGTQHFMKHVGPGTILGNILGISRENSLSGSHTNKGSTQPQKNRQNTQQYHQVEVGKEIGHLMKNLKSGITNSDMKNDILKGNSISDNKKNDHTRQPRQIKHSDEKQQFNQADLEREMGYLMNNTKSGITTSNIKDDILKGHSISDTWTNEHPRQPEQNGKHYDRLQNVREDIALSTKNTQPNTTISNTTNDILRGNNQSSEQKNKLNTKSELNKQVDDILQIDQAELEREVESLMKNTNPGLTISKVDDMFREHSKNNFQMNENSRQNGDRPQHNQAQPDSWVGDSTTNPYRDKTLLNITEDIIREYSQREAQKNEYSRQPEQTVQSDDTLQFDQAELEKEMEYLMKNTKLGNDRFADDKINDPNLYSPSDETKSNNGPVKNVFDHTFEENDTQGEKKPEYSEPAEKTGNEKANTKNDYLKSLYQLKQELEIVLKFSHLIQPNLFKGATKFDDSDPLKYDGDGGADDVKYYKKVEFDQLHDLVHNTKFDVDDIPAEGEANHFKESSDPNDLDSRHHTTHPRPPSPPLGARHISSIFNEMADQGFGMNSNNESFIRNIVSDIRRHSPGYHGPPQKGDKADWYANKRDLIEGSKELYKKVVERIDKINRGEDVDCSSSL